MDIIAITVSFNYIDYLTHTVHVNKKYFKNWIIITDKNDNKTIEFCENNNLKILYYDFYNNNSNFDKGGALKYGQEYAYKNYKDDWFLILDSDICLPNNFYTIISKFNFDIDSLYCAKRNIFENYKSFKENKILNKKDLYDFLGFFQMYKSNNKFYKNSINCSDVDLEFSKLFKNKIYIPNLIVDHLGLDGKNWNGRITGNFNET